MSTFPPHTQPWSSSVIFPVVRNSGSPMRGLVLAAARRDGTAQKQRDDEQEPQVRPTASRHAIQGGTWAIWSAGRTVTLNRVLRGRSL